MTVLICGLLQIIQMINALPHTPGRETNISVVYTRCIKRKIVAHDNFDELNFESVADTEQKHKKACRLPVSVRALRRRLQYVSSA